MPAATTDRLAAPAVDALPRPWHGDCNRCSQSRDGALHPAPRVQERWNKTMAQSEMAASAGIAAAAADDAPMDAADMRRRVKAIFIGSVGNLVEWYDFYAYAAFALYFAHLFFPGDDVV